MANVTVTVLEADGVTETDVICLGVDRQAAATSKSVALATEDKTALDAAVTALQIIDNIVSGSEAQVDIVAALPAGGNTIGAVTNTALTKLGAGEYETVAASQTNQVLGPTGGAGDFLSHVVVSPTTVSPQAFTIYDNATALVSFAGGASSLSNLVPFTIYIGATSSSGAFKVTTGTGLSLTAFGDFT
jgi:hypothetical protein